MYAFPEGDMSDEFSSFISAKSSKLPSPMPTEMMHLEGKIEM